MSRIEDLEEIRQVTYKYFLGWDIDDINLAVDAVFTVDGINDQTAMGFPFVLRGREEMRAMYKDLRPKMKHVFHMVGNHIIEFDDDDHARGTNCQDGIAIMEDGSVLAGKHYFRDTYVRTEDGWRIATREGFGNLPH